MTGVSESQFAPTANVTRATVVTVLWRMEGSPAPTATVSFGDVSPGAWYAQPVAWAKENAKLSGLEDAPIRWIVDDCAKFVEREIRRGKTYDAIIMDPPSYGRGPAARCGSWRTTSMT